MFSVTLSISCSTWLEIKTCTPSRPSSWKSAIISLRTSGSRPESGSSTIRKRGSCAIAAASLVRWRMPFEKPAVRRSIASFKPVRSSARSARARASLALKPERRKRKLTNSRASRSS